MNKEFYKKPGAIAAFVLFIGFFLFPFVNIWWFSVTAFDAFKEFKGQSILLGLFPIASAYIIYAAYAGEKKIVIVAKWILLVLSAWFFLNIAFIQEKHSIDFVGLGLWLNLIVSILFMFENKITAMICKPKVEEDNTNI